MKVTISLVSLLLAGQLLWAQDEMQANRLVEKGIELHDKGDYEGAISLYKKALDADQDNLTALAEISMSCFSAGRYDDVVQYSKRAIEKHSGEEGLQSIFVSYGSALDALKKPDESVEVYEEGLRQFPKAYMLQFNKGITFVNMKEYDRAIICFQKTLLINPRHPGSHNALGRLVAADGKRVPAVLALLRFLALEPNTERARGNIAAVQELLNKGVEQNGKNNVNIMLDPKMLGDTLENGDPKPDNFSTVDLLLTFTAALDFDKAHKKETPRQRFLRKLELICSGLAENKDHSGFYWDFYAPYFVEMQREKFLETFSYIAFATSDDSAVEKWIKGNESQIKAFYDWSSEFDWPEESSN